MKGKTTVKPFKLIAPVKDYIWGGRRLKDKYGKTTDCERTAESWELSVLPDGCSVIADGELAGMKLSDALRDYGLAGRDALNFEQFPILVKLIDSAGDLSVQVHPDDDYAAKNEGQYGKTEMWYVVEAEEGAGIYYGFNRDVTREELENAIADNRVTELLNFVPVKEGEAYFIPSGTVHAICAGLVIWELQQSSNVTYRVYDYDRTGADGKKRELHIGKSLDVCKLKRTDPKPAQGEDCGELQKLASCKYFTAYRAKADGCLTLKCSPNCFLGVTAVVGSGRIVETGMNIDLGDTVFFPAGDEIYTVQGNLTLLIATVGDGIGAAGMQKYTK